ncbi:unnamed protein product [Urochloa humidicola]
MSPKVTPILLAILLGCLAFAANCKGESGYEERPPGDRRWQPAGDEMTGRSSSRKMMDAVAGSCVRSTCEGSTCYCCPTVPTKPCFLELDACLRVCFGRLPAVSASAGRCRFL